MRDDLRADCSRCVALCCVGPGFAKSTDFAIDKPAGVSCPNLAVDFRCSIHERLRPSGFAGCTVYDCFGAGQHVTQVLFGGTDWRANPSVAQGMFATLGVLRQVHEVAYYVDEALDRLAALGIADELVAKLTALAAWVQSVRSSPADAVLVIDTAQLRDDARPLLAAASEQVRATAGPGADRAGVDLAGASLRGVDWRGSLLRGAVLIGADLTGADLRNADLLGADLRGALLHGVRLDSALFVTQVQVNAATGDGTTTLPLGLARPPHWRRHL